MRPNEDAPVALRAKALLSAARVEQGLADYVRMLPLAEESVALYRAIGDPVGAAWALDRMAIAATDQGDLARGGALHEESVATFRRLGDKLGLAVTLNNVSCVYLLRHEPDRAAEASAESLALCRELGRRWGMVLPLGNLALAALEQNRHAEALDFLREGIALAQELDYSEGLVCCLVGLQAALAARGDFERAAMLMGAADAKAETISYVLEPLERRVRDEAVEAAQQMLGEEAFAAAWAAGRELAIDDATAHALAELEPAGQPLRRD